MKLMKSGFEKKLIYRALGPLIFIFLELAGPPESLNISAYHVACITVLMAFWWITEAVPIAVTALLPIILFPLFGVLDLQSTTTTYGHKYIFLYLGGFILAIAIERWNLHQRIALNIIRFVGGKLSHIILGFMVATAFLSMWISNTATTVMMLPIGMAVVSQFKNGTSDSKIGDYFGKALMLGIAYSASIGGIATLIGTPPNLVLAGVLEKLYHIKLGFFQWMKFGLPISMLLLIICWKYLTSYSFKFKSVEFPRGRKEINEIYKKLGKMTYEEKWVSAVFILTACAWIFRALIQKIIPAIDDTIIAMSAAIILFIIPSGNKKQALLTWEDTIKLPWAIILLFGGGMALAEGFTNTGLANWFAERLSGLENIHLWVLILILVSMVNFLTEVTSNMATTAIILPVLAPMALSLNIHPYIIMTGVTLAASCAFMLPVATPPNAIVFGSGYLRITDMVRSGFVMNIISILIITVLVYFLLPVIWGINSLDFPLLLK